MEVFRARRYAARSRILVALAGLGALLADRSIDPRPLTAALGLAVILLTGVLEATTENPSVLRYEEAFSCLAGVFIVGFGEGHVSVITALWLVAAAVGVLARGGRVGGLGRILVLATLASPLAVRGSFSAENAGLAAAAILLLLSTGRLSREMGELLRRARYDADHDALTATFAAGHFQSLLQVDAAAATAGEPVSLLLVDLDDFARVNKRRGHAAGDQILVTTAAAIDALLGPGDLLGRIDGDTFAVRCAGRDALGLAAEIRGAVDGVTLSVGIATAPRDGPEAEALLAAGDVALRVAKSMGKDRAVVYEGEPLTSGADGARVALENLLRGEGLTMAVQPIVDIGRGVVHAYEALARFSSQRDQSPLHWFALADELGLRDELELACLRKALELLGDLPGEALLAVNLSAPMLCDERADRVFAAAGRLDRLVVEVTEEALARDDGSLGAAVAALRERGASFAVDDIGAGYSGLGQVATLRPRYLKLDRGLIAGLEGAPARASLVAAMQGYAVSTDALLVAEGVETEAELNVLRALGVPLVQGYLLGRPGAPWPGVLIAGAAAPDAIAAA
ncbi:MAG: diguanylate cyclase [Solirubrobacteraceae bacterium]|nr:diguanylate cyclase [Solirubrobacteraceae bacterium]